MSAARNQRLAWLAQELSAFKTLPSIVIDAMTKFPNVSEKTIRKELNELLSRLTDIHMQNAPEIKTQLLEQAYKLLEECKSLSQMGPAVNLFKTITQMYGVLSEGKGTQQDGNNSSSGSPESIIVRERIKQLMKDKRVRAEAEAAGVDLDKLAKQMDDDE